MVFRDQTTQAIRIAAHDWQSRIEAGEMTPTDRQSFEVWLAADPRHRSAYDRAAGLWRQIGAIDRSALPARSLQPLRRERLIAWRNAAWRDAGWRRWPLRFAGGFAVLASVLLVLLLIDPSSILSPDSRGFKTQIAETREIVLADGSRVTLGARSSLSVKLGETARRVRLRFGEAFFEVASDPARPFIVESDGFRVEALGTAFDLRRLGDGLRVAVAEGTVAVGSAQPTGDVAPTQLSAGQQVTANHLGGLGDVTAIAQEAVGAWRRDRLVYKGAPLSDVVADANRYHSDWILLRDEKAAQLEITAVFDARDIEGMLAALGEALPVVVRHRPGPIITINGRTADAAGAAD